MLLVVFLFKVGGRILRSLQGRCLCAVLRAVDDTVKRLPDLTLTNAYIKLNNTEVININQRPQYFMHVHNTNTVLLYIGLRLTTAALY